MTNSTEPQPDYPYMGDIEDRACPRCGMPENYLVIKEDNQEPDYPFLDEVVK